MQVRRALLAGFLAVSFSGFALAHHSFQAEYDAKKPVNLTGTVTKVEWTNPHARFYIDVKDSSGKVARVQGTVVLVKDGKECDEMAATGAQRRAAQ